MDCARIFDSISPGHFAPHGIRRGAATYVATASPPSLASIALQGRWSDYHSTQCRPSQQYTSNAAIIIEANPSVPRSTPALVTTLPYQRWQRQGHLPSRLQPNKENSNRYAEQCYKNSKRTKESKWNEMQKQWIGGKQSTTITTIDLTLKADRARH